MTGRIGLRDYQQRLLERLEEVERQPAAVSKLGFLVGSSRWLVDIGDTVEVLPVPEITRFPLTQPWFLGIANIHGDLLGIADFPRFQSDVELRRAPHNRVLVVGRQVGVRCGLLVSRMLGLRRADELKVRHEASTGSAYERAVFEDVDGVVWRELDARALLTDRRFLDVGVV